MSKNSNNCPSKRQIAIKKYNEERIQQARRLNFQLKKYPKLEEFYRDHPSIAYNDKGRFWYASDWESFDDAVMFVADSIYAKRYYIIEPPPLTEQISIIKDMGAIYCKQRNRYYSTDVELASLIQQYVEVDREERGLIFNESKQ